MRGMCCFLQDEVSDKASVYAPAVQRGGHNIVVRFRAARCDRALPSGVTGEIARARLGLSALNKQKLQRAPNICSHTHKY